MTVGQMLAETGRNLRCLAGYALLVGPDNAIWRCRRPARRISACELTSYSYAEAVSRSALPEDFKLDRQPGAAPAAPTAWPPSPVGVVEVQLGGEGSLMAWSEVPQTGWRLLLVVDEADIFRETNRLAEQYLTIGYLLIAGLVFFIYCSGTWMWLRSRRLSDEAGQSPSPASSA